MNAARKAAKLEHRDRLRARKAEKSARRREREAEQIASGELPPDWREQKAAAKARNAATKKARADALKREGKKNVKAREKEAGGKGSIDWVAANKAAEERRLEEIKLRKPKSEWKLGDFGYYKGVPKLGKLKYNAEARKEWKELKKAAAARGKGSGANTQALGARAEEA